MRKPRYHETEAAIEAARGKLPPDGEFLSARAAADLLGVDLTTVLVWLSDARLAELPRPTPGRGSARRIKSASVRRLFAELYPAEKAQG